MTIKLEDIRKLKDQATRAIEKRNYERAALLYVEIAGREPDADWHQRAGEAFRKAGEGAKAVVELRLAAEAYAKGGFLLKAIAVIKSILQVDPTQTEMQARLAELYANRDGAHAATNAAPPMMRPPAAPIVPLAPPASSPPANAPPARAAAPPMLRPPVLTPAAPVVAEIVAARADAPMDAVPLRQVLGARRSQTIAVADVVALAGEDEAPGAYEITLEQDEPSIEIELSVEPHLDDIGAALPRIPLLSSLGQDDLQFLIERMRLSTPDPDTVIVKQGDPGGSLYVLVAGTANVLVDGKQVATLKDGDFFGEVGLLTDEPRTASIVATSAAVVLEISRELSWDIVRRSPEMLRTLLRFLRDRLLERILGSSPLFSSLAPEDARGLASQFVFLELDVGAVAVKQGVRAPGMFFLLSGLAEAVRDGKRLGTLAPGDVFGEMSMLLRTPASADVRALRKCWALELPQAKFQEIMMTYPQVLAYVSDLGDARREGLARHEAAADSRVDLL